MDRLEESFNTQPQRTLNIYRLGHEQNPAKQAEREWLERLEENQVGVVLEA